MRVENEPYMQNGKCIFTYTYIHTVLKSNLYFNKDPGYIKGLCLVCLAEFALTTTFCGCNSAIFSLKPT